MAHPFSYFVLPVSLLILSILVLTCRAEAPYSFRKETNSNGTLTIYKRSATWGIGCPVGSLLIPDNIDGRKIASIGDSAFAGCNELTNVAIQEGITKIGKSAFAMCIPLKNVIIPKSVTSIEEGAFFSAGLIHCTIPGSVTNIGDLTFAFSDDLKSVSFTGSVPRIGTRAFFYCFGLTNVLIPNTAVSIGEQAFGFCWSLPSINIPNSIRSIGDGAFSECSALTNAVIGNGVASIGMQAFSGCPRLPGVRIPDRLGRIAEGTFTGCQSFTNILIPSTVTNLGRWSFMHCTKLVDAYFEGDAPSVIDRYGRPTSDPVFASPAVTTVHFLPGTRGWSSSFSDRPTTQWVRPNPTIIDFGHRFGPSPSGLAFVISWAANLPTVVETTTDLVNQTWMPILTNQLTDGWVQFGDPDWTNHRTRFYRVRGQ